MKTKNFNLSDGEFNWQQIMNEAKNYKYVVMYRDHYRGNGKGEWFKADEFAAIFKQQDFWFYNIERPVFQVILTDDDVPAIIMQRSEIIRELQKVECDIRYTNIPMRPMCDGRATRRTQPEAFAAWDKAKAKAAKKLSSLRSRRDSLQASLDAVQPYYSTTLYHITMQKVTLQDIADFWNEFAANDQEPDMEALNKMIADNGYVNDCHKQWGICHSDTEEVTLRDDMTAYVSNREL